MPSAEIIAIGTELLLGEITDTNTQYIARQLRDCGIDLFRSTTIGDNLDRITKLIQEALARADIVITTGGLGPTVDDPTREAAALAYNTHNEFHPELWEQIKQRFLKRALNVSDNNRKQAMIPAGATVIENPVGTAPSFILSQNDKTLICLPGVPREMEYLLQAAVIPWLKDHYPLSGVIKAKVLHIGAVSESKVDELVCDLEKMTNPSVGLLAHPGIVDIRITAKAPSLEEADKMIAELESTIRSRLSKDIYGVDNETLFGSIEKIADVVARSIRIVICGFSPDSFSSFSHSLIQVINMEKSEFGAFCSDLNSISASGNEFLFTCEYFSKPEVGKLECKVYNNGNPSVFSREYAGAQGLREEWAKNFGLNFIRQQLFSVLNSKGDE